MGWIVKAALLADTVTAYDRAVSLTKERHEAGIVSGLDVARAQTQLDTARSQVSQNQAQRATLEHAIAVLVGESHLRNSPWRLVQFPCSCRRSLAMCRPISCSAGPILPLPNVAPLPPMPSVGVARAAYFPSITLSGAYGFESNRSSEWLTAPNAAWSVGPSILLELFDAGRRKPRSSRRGLCWMRRAPPIEGSCWGLPGSRRQPGPASSLWKRRGIRALRGHFGPALAGLRHEPLSRRGGQLPGSRSVSDHRVDTQREALDLETRQITGERGADSRAGRRLG